MITTGDYSNPELVKVPPLKNGTTVIRYKLNVKLEGSLIVLHFIPQDSTVVKALNNIGKGDRVSITGREERDHSIEGPNGTGFKVFHPDVHRIFLVTKVHHLEE